MTQQAQTQTATQAKPEAPTTQAKAEIVKTTLQRVLGSVNQSNQANARLQWLASAADQAHLVSPSTAVGSLPAGTSLAFSMVQIDADNETYKTGSKKSGDGWVDQVGLSKSALDKIAAAAGVSWDPILSRRMDDGSDPCFCVWQAVGRVRQLDGVELVLVGTVELDMRDGSPTVAALESRAKDGKSAATQLRDMRMYIVRHAESKARLRAIRSMGIRTSYARHELRKPFIVARLMWTGESDDPELRRVFAEKTADHFLGARNALYGGPAPLAIAAPTAVAPSQRMAITPEEMGFDEVPADAPAAPAEPTSSNSEERY